MEAKDLRIGNFVVTNFKREKEVTDIDHVSFIEDFMKLYDPIPLTEEWLLKFEQFGKTDIEGTPCFFNGDNIMLFDRKDYFDAYLHSEVDGSVFFATRLFHVHQLQNFYYAIEKQELTIKE
jgi:hypothetical protein